MAAVSDLFQNGATIYTFLQLLEQALRLDPNSKWIKLTTLLPVIFDYYNFNDYT